MVKCFGDPSATLKNLAPASSSHLISVNIGDPSTVQTRFSVVHAQNGPHQRGKLTRLASAGWEVLLDCARLAALPDTEYTSALSEI